jgi:glycosyltransferase involved in cell wall biosynthesis
VGTDTQLCAVCGQSLDKGCHGALVVPIFKSEQHIEHVFAYADEIAQGVPSGIHLVFVDDGSPDGAVGEVRRIAQDSRLKVSLVRLSRNFGVGPAVHAGLTGVDECATVVFGSDLQEPHELFIQFINKILFGEAEVCLGQRTSRDDPFMMRFFAGIYWWINRKFMQNDTPKGGFDVFGLSRSARIALVELGELNTSLTSQLQWIGFRRVYIPYVRQARISGKSTWTMRRKFKLFADSIYGFTGAPIALLFVIGAVAVGALGIVSMATFIGWLLGWIDIAGYTTIVLLLAVGQAVNLLALGILGGYLYRTFDNSKGRPRYIARSYEKLRGE